jgi:hypothetical protein
MRAVINILSHINSMSSKDNPIIEDSPILLTSMDEFENERSSLLIKYFHSVIKEQLKDPNKQFILLVNSDISFKKYRSVWTNNPQQIDKLFVELTEKEDQKNPVLTPEQRNDIPKLVPIYTAEASDYYTDPETGTQYFPESIFNYDNNNYWKSVAEGKKELKIMFSKQERIKYMVIDFLESAKTEYEFEIGYNSGQKGNDGKAIYNFIRDPQDNDKRLSVKTELKDELQFIEFGSPILTTELVLNFTGKEAGVNYLFLIENDLSKEAIKSFLELKIEP